VKFLANENFPFPSIKVIKASFEVFSIAEIAPGISDREVLQKAIKENLAILTFDRDYGEIIFKEKIKNPPTVIYFRAKGAAPDSAGKMLMELLQDRKIRFEEKFSVIEANGIRQRSYQK